MWTGQGNDCDWMIVKWALWDHGNQFFWRSSWQWRKMTARECPPRLWLLCASFSLLSGLVRGAIYVSPHRVQSHRCVCVCACASVLGCFSSSLPLSPLVASVRHWHDSKSADLPVHPNQSLMKPGMQSARCATGDRQQHPARVPSLPPFVPAQKSPTLVQSC